MAAARNRGLDFTDRLAGSGRAGTAVLVSSTDLAREHMIAHWAAVVWRGEDL